MGRKKGSKNKVKKGQKLPERSIEVKGTGKKWKYKKWKKTYKESKYAKHLREEEELHPATGLKICKLMGFCPKCKSILGKMDILKGKKNIILCQVCGFRGRISKLSKEHSKKEIKSKREHLEDCQDILESMPKVEETPIDLPEDIGKIDREEW